MAKDPAFLFYSNDFEVRTKFFTNEQVGKYMRLLITQHQFGHLTRDRIICVGGPWDDVVMEKFSVDEKGMFFNERLEYEVNRRQAFCRSRKESIQKRYVRSSSVIRTNVRMEHRKEKIENERRNKKFNRNGIVKPPGLIEAEEIKKRERNAAPPPKEWRETIEKIARKKSII